jgi:hypothetical protein
MMKKNQKTVFAEDLIGCIGDFQIDDPVCRRFCAVRIRCSIESSYHIQSEIYDDMTSPDTAGTMNQ